MSESFRTLPRSVQTFVILDVLAYSAAATWALPHSQNLVAAGLVAIFAATGLVKPVSNPLGGITDFNLGVIIVAALLWQPQDVMLGVGFGSFIGLLLFRRNEVWRASMNAAGWGLCSVVGATVAHWAISSAPFAIPPFAFGAPSAIAPLAIAGVLAVVAYRATNTAIFAIYRSLRFAHSFLTDVLQDLPYQWPSQLLAVPLAVVLAAVADIAGNVWSGLGLTAAFTMVLPLARQEFTYYNRAREMLDEIVEAVMRALEGVDPAARTHAERVSALAVQIGMRMGMSERGLLALRLAALLHDVGLLSGPGAATGEGHHAAVGARILAQFPDPQIADIVRAHHERWDGEGVPDHRRGLAIPLGARILAAAEMYDSLRMGLAPFGASVPYERAVHHLSTLAGSALDPQVIAVLLQVVGEQEQGKGFMAGS